MIGVFPLHVVQREVNSGELAVINFELNIDKSAVGVTYRNIDGLSPAATAFLAELRSVAAKFEDDQT